jgi:hypothetical protein
MTGDVPTGNLDDLQVELNSDFDCMTLHDDMDLYTNNDKETVRVASLEYPERGVYHAAIIWPNPKWSLETVATNFPDSLTNTRDSVAVISGHRDIEEEYNIHDSIFSGTVFFYTNSFEQSEFSRDDVRKVFEDFGYNIRIRDDVYRESILPNEGWDVFISHDSSDSEFAKEVYQELFRHRVYCWFDQSVLRPGDSLAKQIANGLNESDYAILVLSENYIDNVGWASDEWQGLRSIAVAEDKNVIIPVWLDVSVDEVRDFSPWLSQIVAIQASSVEDADTVADEIKSIVRE